MAEGEISPSIETLEQLIGQRVQYLNHTWRIIEVLDEEKSIVLEAIDDNRQLMGNAHGEPVRDLPEVLSLSVDNPFGSGINPALKEMRLIDQS